MTVPILEIIVILLGFGAVIRLLAYVTRQSSLREIMSLIGEALLLVSGGAPSDRER